MKEKCLILIFCLCLSLTGCTKKVESDSESKIEFQENQWYAVKYLGYQVMDDTKPFVEQYLDGNEPDRFYLSDGDIYLIVPRYPNMKMKLMKYNIDTDNKDLIYESDNCKPFLVHCNVSDIIADTTIEFEYEGEKVEFTPFVSLKDGSIEVGEKGKLVE